MQTLLLNNSSLRALSQKLLFGDFLWALFTMNEYLTLKDPLRAALLRPCKKRLLEFQKTHASLYERVVQQGQKRRSFQRQDLYQHEVNMNESLLPLRSQPFLLSKNTMRQHWLFRKYGKSYTSS